MRRLWAWFVSQWYWPEVARDAERGGYDVPPPLLRRED